ncbi:pectate lyase-domain-containing protein [Blastocladiella britannica]|nr:pectate lyase-domain-containing protein [Blastocladiella britannica]
MAPINSALLVLLALVASTVSAFDMPTPTKFVKIDNTIVVKAGEVFDGKGAQFDFKTPGLCKGQKETSSGMIFQVLPGGTVKNAIIGPNQSEGIHCDKGSCTIQNVWWADVCEDALSIKGDNTQGSRVIGGGATNAQDKVVQHNGKGTVTIDGFQTKDIGKLYRSCGTCGAIKRTVTLRNIKAEGRALTLVGINSNNGDVATFEGNISVGSGIKQVCQTFIARGKSEPTKNTVGAGNGCNFKQTQVKKI